MDQIINKLEIYNDDIKVNEITENVKESLANSFITCDFFHNMKRIYKGDKLSADGVGYYVYIFELFPHLNGVKTTYKYTITRS